MRGARCRWYGEGRSRAFRDAPSPSRHPVACSWGRPSGKYPRVPLFGADRLRAAYGLDAPAPPPLVDVLA